MSILESIAGKLFSNGKELALTENINDGVGIDQTYQAQVLGSDPINERAENTTYTNTTGKPIVVTVYCAATSSPPATIIVGGLTVHRITSTGTLNALIPAGDTYNVTDPNTIYSWVELREVI